VPARALPRGLSFWHPVCLFSSWFGIGLIPGAPGTWGSLAALPMAWYMLKFHGPVELAILGGSLFLIGCWSSGVYARRTNDSDPGTIVIDEVAAQCLVLTAVPTKPGYFVAAFIAFRLADILKPWPASWADRSVKGGFGIMLDDILAGMYVWALMYGVVLVLN
jgi:phosphatidylglycerophosphatase A